MNIKSDGNKPDSPKGLSRLSQKFAMSNFMMMVLRKVSLMMIKNVRDDHC